MLFALKKLRRTHSYSLRFALSGGVPEISLKSNYEKIQKKKKKKKKKIFSYLRFFKANFQDDFGLQWTCNLNNLWHKCLSFKKTRFKDRLFALVFSKWRPGCICIHSLIFFKILKIKKCWFLQNLQGFEIERRKGIKMYKSQESAALRLWEHFYAFSTFNFKPL